MTRDAPIESKHLLESALAFISEVNFVGSSGVSGGEYVEIVLGPGDDPADFVVSAYRENGTLHTGAGIPGGEVNLSTLTGTADPDNPNFTVYVIPLGIRDSTSDADEATGVALTNIASDDVLGFYSSHLYTITPTQGAAVGASSDAVLDFRAVGTGNSANWDIYGNYSISTVSSGDATLCVSGTSLIRCARGLVRAADLREGDAVWTLDHGPQPIRWIGRFRVTGQEMHDTAALRPVRVSAGVLGAGMPARDMELSPQHRVVLRSPICEKMFACPEVLVAVKKLCGFDGISSVESGAGITYFHLLFDRHEIIEADGALVESLLIAERSLKILKQDSARALSDPLPRSIGSARSPMIPARRIITGKKLKKLLARHQKNGKPLVSEARASVSLFTAG